MIDKGFVILAQNNSTVDYIACARALARSLRAHKRGYQLPIALVTADKDCDHRDCFDFVIEFPHGDQAHGEWRLHNDWQLYAASPFEHTIKLEADMIVTRNIDHWFDAFKHRDLVISGGVRDYQNQPAQSRAYRELFDRAQLPDVYNAVTYWCRSHTAWLFFNLLQVITKEWEMACEIMGVACEFNTDMAYALAAAMMDIDPRDTSGVLDFVHMKPHINGIATADWTSTLILEHSPQYFRINTFGQLQPVHYVVKTMAEQFERAYVS